MSQSRKERKRQPRLDSFESRLLLNSYSLAPSDPYATTPPAYYDGPGDPTPDPNPTPDPTDPTMPEDGDGSPPNDPYPFPDPLDPVVPA